LSLTKFQSTESYKASKHTDSKKKQTWW